LYVTNIPISVPTNCQALLFSSATNSSTSTNQLSGVVGAWH
jgi:hypothetical protein